MHIDLDRLPPDQIESIHRLAAALDLTPRALLDRVLKQWADKLSGGTYAIPDCTSGGRFWDGRRWRLIVKVPFSTRGGVIRVPIPAIRPESEIQGIRQSGILVMDDHGGVAQIPNEYLI